MEKKILFEPRLRGMIFFFSLEDLVATKLFHAKLRRDDLVAIKSFFLLLRKEKKLLGNLMATRSFDVGLQITWCFLFGLKT